MITPCGAGMREFSTKIVNFTNPCLNAANNESLRLCPLILMMLTLSEKSAGKAQGRVALFFI
jgi:hypothetical protein